MGCFRIERTIQNLECDIDETRNAAETAERDIRQYKNDLRRMQEQLKISYTQHAEKEVELIVLYKPKQEIISYVFG